MILQCSVGVSVYSAMEILSPQMVKNISKRDYRCHAHTNPFKDRNIDVPESPGSMDWSPHFGNAKAPTLVDIGCGYGKFLMDVARLVPNENVLGLEIRDKVAEYVQHHTKAMPNCSVIRSNALLFLPNFFTRNSLKKIFVLFPDPHYKRKKQKGRVICRQTMQVLKYLLENDGMLYISTDVKNLFQDMCTIIESSGCFVEEKNTLDDTLFEMCYKGTDEAGRAGVKSGHTFGKVYRVLK